MNLLQPLLSQAEEVLPLFDEYVEHLAVLAARPGQKDRNTVLLRELQEESAVFADLLAEAEYGELFGLNAEARYGLAGVPLLAFVLLKLALEIDWRLDALAASGFPARLSSRCP